MDHMQRISFPFSVALFVVSALSFASFALADQVEDPADNWCYAGGVWGDGRCSVPDNPALTEWYWTCGYYRAQVVKGAYSIIDIPQTCQYLVAQDSVGSTGSRGNIGNTNTGDFNTGGSNSGSSNTGGTNTGNFNTGGSNSGSSNTGGTNTGDFNTGGSNSGSSNTGVG
jgi:hypothetical protein